MVSTVSTQFEAELKKIIQAEIVRVQDILGVGDAVDDYAKYKFLTGQLFAYRRVLDSYADEVNTIISTR